MWALSLDLVDRSMRFFFQQLAQLQKFLRDQVLVTLIKFFDFNQVKNVHMHYKQTVICILVCRRS